MKTLLAAFAALLILVSPGAAAEADPKPASEKDSVLDSFRLLDTDGDGAVTRYEGPEERNWLPGVFAAYDADSDGGITLEEYRAWAPSDQPLGVKEEWGETAFELFDTNKDDRISVFEWVGTADGFADRDADKDGFVSRAEGGALSAAAEPAPEPSPSPETLPSP